MERNYIQNHQGDSICWQHKKTHYNENTYSKHSPFPYIACFFKHPVVCESACNPGQSGEEADKVSLCDMREPARLCGRRGHF